jgi:hypothetical protein
VVLAGNHPGACRFAVDTGFKPTRDRSRPEWWNRAHAAACSRRALLAVPSASTPAPVFFSEILGGGRNFEGCGVLRTRLEAAARSYERPHQPHNLTLNQGEDALATLLDGADAVLLQDLGTTARAVQAAAPGLLPALTYCDGGGQSGQHRYVAMTAVWTELGADRAERLQMRRHARRTLYGQPLGDALPELPAAALPRDASSPAAVLGADDDRSGVCVTAVVATAKTSRLAADPRLILGGAKTVCYLAVARGRPDAGARIRARGVAAGAAAAGGPTAPPAAPAPRPRYPAEVFVPEFRQTVMHPDLLLAAGRRNHAIPLADPSTGELVAIGYVTTPLFAAPHAAGAAFGPLRVEVKVHALYPGAGDRMAVAGMVLWPGSTIALPLTSPVLQAKPPGAAQAEVDRLRTTSGQHYGQHYWHYSRTAMAAAASSNVPPAKASSIALGIAAAAAFPGAKWQNVRALYGAI